jgi:hypothetical protein
MGRTGSENGRGLSSQPAGGLGLYLGNPAGIYPQQGRFQIKGQCHEIFQAFFCKMVG